MNDKTQTYFAQIPLEILSSTDLTPSQKLLYAAIHGLTQKCGYCFANNQYFAEFFNKKKGTISNDISVLVKKDLLFILGGSGGKSIRRLYTVSTYKKYCDDKK